MKLERTLPSVWVLHGFDVPALAPVAGRGRTVVVADVEYLCAAVVREVAASGQPYAPRSFAQMDEELAFLLGQVDMLVSRYDPSRGRAVYDPWRDGFRAWLYLELKRDEIDNCRSRFGRDGAKHDLIDLRPYQRAEEAERAAEIDQPDPLEDGIRSFADRFHDALEGGPVDDPDAWFVGRGWDDLRRDRKAARQVEAVGLGAPAPSARRNRAAVERGELAA
ncbi:MAG: hypothetical protein ACJ768_12735 [Gaiellaceae bacterium]